jgi:hypothetical protein
VAAPALPDIHDRRDTRVDAGEVRIDAGAVDALEDVRVKIDEPRRHELAGHVDDPRRLRRRNVRRDARDGALLDCDVEDVVEPARRIHHPATLEDEIVHGVPPEPSSYPG